MLVSVGREYGSDDEMMIMMVMMMGTMMMMMMMMNRMTVLFASLPPTCIPYSSAQVLPLEFFWFDHDDDDEDDDDDDDLILCARFALTKPITALALQARAEA